MKVTPILYFLLKFVLIWATDFDKDEGIIVLRENNFERALKEFDYLLIEFYAPWCGHCKALAPEYVNAAQLLKDKDSEIKLAKVDGTLEESLVTKHEISGYPTLLFYRKGEAPIKYNGGRMASDIVAWLEKKTGPPALILTDISAIESFIEEHEVAVIGFFKDPESNSSKKYLSAIRDYETYPMALSSVEESFEKYSTSDETIILFKKFDEGRAVYAGAIDKDVLLEFVERYALPLVIDFNHETAQKIFKGLVKSHILFFMSKNSQDSEKSIDVIKDLASEFKHKIMFVIVDTDEEDHRRIIEYLGLKTSELPTMRIITMKDDILKFKPQKSDFEKENIQAFVQDFLNGKLEQNYKTEDLPEDWNDKPVKVLTAINFDDVTLDKSKDVIVEFYAPWCGHCKKLIPIWDELGALYEKKENVVVGKMDATLNELPHTKILSFPTIKLYKKETNEAVEYNGERTLDGIVKFLSSDGVYGQAAPDHDEL